MNLSPHFTVAEFTNSDTAARKGINNSIPAALMKDAVLTAQMMERIRNYLSGLKGFEVAIEVTSAHRCPTLNRAIGSDDGSDHVKMAAVDFRAASFGTPYEVAMALSGETANLGVGQLIHEFGRWVHVSRLKPAKQVNSIITYKFPKQCLVGIQKV
jgi:uncharacterized protein YcbK (DUF882 family)